MNASLWGKLQASRLHALEALSRVLFDDDQDGAQSQSASSDVWAGEAAREQSLQDRLRRRATILVQEEREILRRELHSELESERKRFEARKPAISDEAHRAARKEQAAALERKEHELQVLLARRKFKNLEDAARERLAVLYAQERENTLARLKRSLERGTGHSVSCLRGELWEEAHTKRNRALHEGEEAFAHSCRLLRQQSDRHTQAKIEAMCKEAAIAEESALAALREVEAKVTSGELYDVASDLEHDRRDAEAELKHQLHEEAATTIALAVDTCTLEHKRAQEETVDRAAAALRRALEAAGDDEVANTKAALSREARMLDDRRFSLVAAVEDGLSACSLRKLATGGSSLSPFSPPSSPSSVKLGRRSFPTSMPRPKSSPIRALRHQRDRKSTNRKAAAGVGRLGKVGNTVGDDDVDNNNEFRPSYGKREEDKASVKLSPEAARVQADRAASAAAGAVSAVRCIEGAAAAAEREFTKRARALERFKTAAALRERHRKPPVR